MVESITKDGINQDVDWGDYGGMNYAAWFSNILWRDVLLPVPLTEQWLKKFKFQGPGFRDYWERLDIEFPYVIKNGDNWEVHVTGNSDTITIAAVKYVHEFQNLFYILKGEELDVKN